jgi:hypothetical protein
LQNASIEMAVKKSETREKAPVFTALPALVARRLPSLWGQSGTAFGRPTSAAIYPVVVIRDDLGNLLGNHGFGW